MSGLPRDLARALSDVFSRPLLGVVLRAVALTLAVLVALSAAVLAALGWVLPDQIALPWIGPVGFLDELAFGSAVIAVLAGSVVLMVPVAGLVLGLMLESVAAAVEARHYPDLPPARSVPLSESLADALRFTAVLVAVNLVALVLALLLAPLAPFIWWAANGLLLGREYFMLVALRRLDEAEARRLRRRHALAVFAAGVLMAVPLSLPVVNLIVPVAAVALFVHMLMRIAAPGRRPAADQ